MYIQIIVNLIFCKITINYVNNLFKKYSRQIHCMHVNLQNAILSIFFMSRLFQFLSVRIFFFGHSTAENDIAFNIKFLSSSTSPSNYAWNRQFHIFFFYIMLTFRSASGRRTLVQNTQSLIPFRILEFNAQ